MAEQKKEIVAEIRSNERVCEGHWRMELKSGALAGKAIPGQFVNVLVCDQATDPLLRIPLGIHRIRKGEISVFYKIAGKATSMLAAKRKGEKLNVLGPLGNGFKLSKTRKAPRSLHILVAGGHGAAPLYAVAEALVEKEQKVRVFLGAASKKCVVLAGEFKRLGCEVKVSTDDGSAGRKGYVTCLVEDLFLKNKEKKDIEVYACGPRPMLGQLSRVLGRQNARAQVSVDPYMACGTGVCRGCAVMTTGGYKLACKDGPVFYSDEIVWEKGKGCS
jgi:dihydroorotate dehydrogenase electron transfer subunit